MRHPGEAQAFSTWGSGDAKNRHGKGPSGPFFASAATRGIGSALAIQGARDPSFEGLTMHRKGAYASSALGSALSAAPSMGSRRCGERKPTNGGNCNVGDWEEATFGVA